MGKAPGNPSQGSLPDLPRTDAFPNSTMARPPPCTPEPTPPEIGHYAQEMPPGERFTDEEIHRGNIRPTNHLGTHPKDSQFIYYERNTLPWPKVSATQF